MGPCSTSMLVRVFRFRGHVWRKKTSQVGPLSRPRIQLDEKPSPILLAVLPRCLDHWLRLFLLRLWRPGPVLPDRCSAGFTGGETGVPVDPLQETGALRSVYGPLEPLELPALSSPIQWLAMPWGCHPSRAEMREYNNKHPSHLGLLLAVPARRLSTRVRATPSTWLLREAHSNHLKPKESWG